MFWDYALPLMAEKGISQNQLSKEIGKGKSQVNKWIERGTTPPVDCALKIALFLGVQIEYFFPELYPNIIHPSDRRRRFRIWVENMSEEELDIMERMLSVLGENGEKLRKL